MKAVDVARWFYKNNIQATNSIDGNIVVQKLCYYSQAMYMAVYNEPLFEEKIVAWKNGPVINEVYKAYKWYYNLFGIPNKEFKISNTIERVLKVVNSVYGVKTPDELIKSTHSEMPWKQYEDIADDINNNPEIDKATIKNYYKDLKQIYEANKDNNFDDECLFIYRGCNFSYMKSNIKNINDYREEIKEFLKNQDERKSFNVCIDINGELEIYD